LIGLLALSVAACGSATSGRPEASIPTSSSSTTPVADTVDSVRDSRAAFGSFMRVALDGTAYPTSSPFMDTLYEVSVEWICADLRAGMSLPVLREAVESVEVIHQPRSDVPIFARALVDGASRYVCPDF
jgi:hypothetical protein